MRDIIRPSVILFLICVVVSACLAFTYSITKEKIEERADLDAQNSRKEVLPEANTFKKMDNIAEIRKDKPELNMVSETYTGLKDNAVIGYVFTVVGKGYGGEMKITVGVDKEGRITGVKIGENKETPGLGSKASDRPFKSQLVNITPKEPLKVIKGKKSKPEEVEAISGATITSKAVVKAVQAALDMSAEIMEMGGNRK